MGDNWSSIDGWQFYPMWDPQIGSPSLLSPCCHQHVSLQWLLMLHGRVSCCLHFPSLALTMITHWSVYTWTSTWSLSIGPRTLPMVKSLPIYIIWYFILNGICNINLDNIILRIKTNKIIIFNYYFKYQFSNLHILHI